MCVSTRYIPFEFKMIYIFISISFKRVTWLISSISKMIILRDKLFNEVLLILYLLFNQMIITYSHKKTYMIFFVTKCCYLNKNKSILLLFKYMFILL